MSEQILPRPEKVPEKSNWGAFFDGIIATGKLFLAFSMWIARIMWKFINWVSEIVGKKMEEKKKKNK